MILNPSRKAYEKYGIHCMGCERCRRVRTPGELCHTGAMLWGDVFYDV